MFRLSKMSLANRSVIALLTVILALFGFVSVGQLKQELFPSLEFPSAAIVTTYPGASPEVMDSQVSRSIESAVSTLEGVNTTTSTSQSSLSTVRVTFDFGTSSAKVSELLNNALDSVKSTLPSAASPKVYAGGLDTIPVVLLSVASKDGDNTEISKLLPDVATTLFKKVPGVKDVQIGGIRDYRVNIAPNQMLLATSGLNAQSIQTALKTNGFVFPAGTLEDNQGQITVEVGSPVESIEALKSLPLNANLTIGDVAKVTFDPAPIETISRVDGKPSLAISITKTQEGNTVSISRDLQPLEKELVDKLGGSSKVEVKETFNQAPYVEKSILDLVEEGLLGLLFAVIIILIFLRSFRSTLVTAVSIPTSLLITFIGLYSFGYSLNLFTLSALTIAIGRVVDDSIVVIENINRHLSYGEEKIQAILSSVKEVAGAITAATLTTVAVFLPIAGVGGLVGQLFRPFALTFALALVASLFVSLTIVPVIAYWFLKAKERKGQKLSLLEEQNLIAQIREEENEKEKKSILQKGYLPVLTATQKRPVITLVAAVLVLIFTFNLVPLLKTNFIGNSGSNSFSITQTVAPGSSLEAKSAAAAKVEKLLMDTGDTVAVTTTIGANDSRVAFGQQAGGTQFQVSTKKTVNGETFQTKMEKIFKNTADIGTVKFESGGSFGSSGTVDVTVTAKSDEGLRAGVSLVTNALKGKIKDVSPEITSTLSEKQRTLKVTIDRVAAARMGLSEIAISQIVAGAMSPQSIGTININNTATAIYIKSGTVPTKIDQVKAIQIGPMRLAQLAKVELVAVPTKITTQDGERAATVSLTPDPKASLTTITADVQKAIDPLKDKLPAGVSLLPIGGVSADQAESFSQLLMALLAAICIVYLIMVATFRSLVQPLVLLISIPFAATGAFVALLITNTALGLPALIGMLLLVGIVVTNAIVLIDLINQYRAQGVPLEQAIMDGARQRLRPILMTALATIGALSPLVLGITGSGGFISQPLGIVVTGGLFSSTILTLIIVPVLYRLIEGRKEKRALKKLNA